MLVPETDYVAQLVNNNAKLVAILADGNGLRSVPSFPDEGTAATGTFGKNDVILMFGSFLNEFDACVVLPVPHGLFKKCTMITTEVAFDFIWNDSEVPQTFSPCSRSTWIPFALCCS